MISQGRSRVVTSCLDGVGGHVAIKTKKHHSLQTGQRGLAYHKVALITMVIIFKKNEDLLIRFAERKEKFTGELCNLSRTIEKDNSSETGQGQKSYLRTSEKS